MPKSNFVRRLLELPGQTEPVPEQMNADMYLTDKFSFDDVAEIYYKETGFMRPGKDDSRGIHTRTERQSRWLRWLAQYYKYQEPA